MDKIVVHDDEGRITKGHSSDFSPHLPYFHLATLQCPFDSEKICLGNQKAVFFVKDFTGDSSHIDLQDWNRAPDSVKHVVVTFKDGEKLIGTAESVNSCHTGFFLYPVDPYSNIVRVYVINSFISSVKIADD
jgi:hypothetical protein